MATATTITIMVHEVHEAALLRDLGNGTATFELGDGRIVYALWQGGDESPNLVVDWTIAGKRSLTALAVEVER